MKGVEVEAETDLSLSNNTALVPLADGPSTAIDSDGYIYDVDTGEVLGREDTAEGFTVDSHDAANRVLALRAKLEGDALGIAARLAALKSHLEAQERAIHRRLAWWDFRFHTPLVEFARSTLRGRSRTALFDWGRVSFRRSQGSATIVDNAMAIAYVEQWAPDKVTIRKSVGVTAVREAAAIAARATGEPEGPLPFLAETGPQEIATVSTDVSEQ